MVITKLAPAGTHIKKGDFLVEFDPQAQTKDYLEKKGAYESLVGQVAQKRKGRSHRELQRRYGDETGGRRTQTHAPGAPEK
jgi:hypothetical protein